MIYLSKLAWLLCFINTSSGIWHNITLQDEGRKNFPLSTFGFFEGGKLILDIKKFKVKNMKADKTGDKYLGFSLQSTKNDGISSYMEKISTKCLLADRSEISNDMKIILFSFNLKDKKIKIERFGDKEFKLIKIVPVVNATEIKFTLRNWLESHYQAIPHRPENVCDNSSKSINELDFPQTEDNSSEAFTVRLEVEIGCCAQQGLYNLYFHNCFNYGLENTHSQVLVDLEMQMIEHNKNNFLSAGDIPLPLMYGFMSCGFFMASIIWTIYLHKQRVWLYKIHWLMAAVIYIKTISVAFHALNYYYTGKEGLHIQTWAVLYYIIHLLKGALLFTAIVLIGTGYFFVKHVLSSKEKKLFIIVIPLQVIANVAQIIIESTEEGDKSYKYWSQIALIVDLVCCGAILLPVVWSIKHLSEAAKTDGKAAISLQKLKLFRHFYVVVVGYIYFTRIIVYLIKITVPFQYMWLDEFFTEIATALFFIFTGYNFRPINDNPYLHLPQEESEDEIEMNDISVHSSYGDRLTRVNKPEARMVQKT